MAVSAAWGKVQDKTEVTIIKITRQRGGLAWQGRFVWGLPKQKANMSWICWIMYKTIPLYPMLYKHMVPTSCENLFCVWSKSTRNKTQGNSIRILIKWSSNGCFTISSHTGSCADQQPSALVSPQPIPEEQCIKKQTQKIDSVPQTLSDGLIYIRKDIKKVQESNGCSWCLNGGHKSSLPQGFQIRWTEWG